jgi:exportin-5
MYRFIVSQPDILGPLLLFAKSALRFRDTRSVTLMIRLLRLNVLPAFREPGNVHTFLCHDTLQAAIISLHEPYFVDSQKDLASLIAQIIQFDDEIPKNVILQLPGLGSQTAKVEHALSKIRSSASDRQARAWVLELLKDLRGVSIHEMGKIERAPVDWKKKEYMAVDESVQIHRGGSPALEGLSDMFQH